MPDLLESTDAGRGDRPLTADASLPISTPASEREAGRGGATLTRAEPSIVRERATKSVLLFEQASKWYGPVIGVNQVTLELRPGITGLVGHNGNGKSTLLRLAAGQMRPDLGRVVVAGHDAWSADAKRHLGYCPELDTFYEEMSGRRFVEVMAQLCGYPGREARRRTAEILELVGMADRAEGRLRGYSKGMRQRIKLAQALLHDPELLLL